MKAPSNFPAYEKVLLRKNKAIKKPRDVTIVRGKAPFKNFIKPFLKFLLLISSIKDSECLIECKKQK